MDNKKEATRSQTEEMERKEVEKQIQVRDKVEQQQRNLEEKELKEGSNFEMRRHEIESILKIQRDHLTRYDQEIIQKEGKHDDVQRKVE